MSVTPLSIRIGFAGGMANNMYVMAKSFRNLGFDVSFFRDELDNFPFSQPLWEDCRLILNHENLSQAHSLSNWLELEKNLGWPRPDFFLDSVTSAGGTSAISRLPEKTSQASSEGTFETRLLSFFRSVDVVIVCGVHVERLAQKSGTPYLIFPHGGDIRLASRFGAPLRLNWKTLKDYSTYRSLRNSFMRAGAVISHSATGVGGHVSDVPFEIRYAPLPMPQSEESLRADAKPEVFRRLFAELGVKLPRGKNFVFIPSRTDFFWKGTDMLIESILQVMPKTLHFVFAGWGNDFEKARSMLPKSIATFLPFALSKPLLFKVFQSAELVIDQFRMGCYGTSALEAISVNAPVMMKIDLEPYREKGWEPPPIINVSSPNDISGYLRRLDDEALDLTEFIEQASDWFARTHEETVAVPRIASIVEEVINAL